MGNAAVCNGAPAAGPGSDDGVEDGQDVRYYVDHEATAAALERLRALLALPHERSLLDEEDEGDGYTPAICAASYGNVDMLKLLLDHGASVNKASGRTGEAPLHAAAAAGHGGVIVRSKGPLEGGNGRLRGAGREPRRDLRGV